MNNAKEIYSTEFRNSLKRIIKSKINTLPNTFIILQPEKRVDVICRFLHYAFPKIESVYYDDVEQCELI